MRGRLTRRGFRSLLSFAVVAAAALSLSSSAAGKPGEPDPSFGHKGMAVAPLDLNTAGLWQAVRVHMARAPEGRIVVTGNRKVFRFLPSGRLDRSFGNEGVLDVEAFPENLDGLAVDSAGRIVTLSSYQGRVQIRRFLPDGLPDPTLGAGTGVVESTFGLPPTLAIQGTAGPNAFGLSVAVDQFGRILVSGLTTPWEGPYIESEGFVARLTPEGAIDPTFGSKGVVIVKAPVSNRAEGLLLDPTGAPIFLGEDPEHRGGPGLGSAVFRLTADGAPAPRFGEGGYQRIAGTRPGGLALDRAGRILASDGKVVVRLLSSGALDPSFGKGGRTAELLGGRWSQLSGLASAGHGTTLVVGTRARREVSAESHHLVLIRLGSRGQPDRRFGRRGFVRDRLGPQSESIGSELLLDGRGHVVVAGTAISPRLPQVEGLVLFRFDLH
jgi:uncharacterized delta-60 repeat protein